MPKPFSHLTGNGCHFHMSLWKDGENAFEVDPSDDPRGMGLSPLAYNFVGGLKTHAKAYIAVTAPTVGSYKRLVVGTRSGSSWAPVYVSYGYNNRTQMLRVPAAGRVEDRTVDGSCNPYLGAAAVLAAGLDGIERELDPGEPTTELNLHELDDARRAELGVELLPGNLLDATRELEKCDVLRKALGNTGREDYVDYFVKIKRQEFQDWHEQVTQWEIDRYCQPGGWEGLQKEGENDRQGHDRGEHVSVRHSKPGQHSHERRRDHSGFPRPAQERQLVARPACSAVRECAREHGERPCHEHQRGQHGQGGQQIVAQLVERDVRTEHHEDDQGDDVRQVEREVAHVLHVRLVRLPQPQVLHVPDDQPG
jgi:hypothetical protein